MSERFRRGSWLGFAIAALLAIALAMTGYFLVGANGSLDDARRSRSAVCDALGAKTLLDIRTAAALYRAGAVARADERLPSEALGTYVRHCTGADDVGGKLAERLDTLIANLYHARRADDLDALANALTAAPPNEWGSARLPVDPGGAAKTTHLIGWEDDETVAKAKAHAEGKGIMVFLTATWCVPCQKLEQMLGNAEPYAIMSRAFVPLRVDVTTDDAVSAATRARYQAEGSLPRVQFLDLDGDQLAQVGTISEDTPNYLEASGLKNALNSANAARGRTGPTVP